MVRSIFMTIILIFGTLTIIKPNEPLAFSGQTIERGAFGDDVIELQARLQYVGFYKGKIDGIFGYGTYWALRNFQEQYGLGVDGIAGGQSKDKLVKASEYHRDWVYEQIEKGNRFTHYGGKPLAQQTSAGAGTAESSDVQLPVKYSERDLQLMANAVYGEARGEPYEGQVAVAAVILNRLESAEFPNTISDIIFQPGAFTAVADGQIWLTPNARAKEAVLDAMNGWDPTENALYYFNPKTATSKWIWSRPQIKQIGEHIFCY
ncbi:N-acetylmuramoyl-L-alanine amidase [Ureibacillus chungkukjangi]|uniref:Spore cortex-lytic enzyme n=2 Tax=Ureibacillus chungkukjangi TaxID=1202712 RepID=A0A318TLU0_9BACL|nr:N-acetylmuramoyl-L-alanine amidase [Ureibacillus chungkukjangi]